MTSNNTLEPHLPGDSRLAEVFDPRSQYSTWRELWYYLAHSQRELGLGSISLEAIAEMETNLVVTDKALKGMCDTGGDEKKRILQHIYEFAQDAPAALGWINWDAPVTYVAENTHAILLGRALDLLTVKVLRIVKKMRVFALEQHCEQVKSSNHQSIQIETSRQTDELICLKAGFKGYYDYAAFPGDTYNVQISWEAGNAVVRLARTFSRLVSEIYQLRAKDPPTMAGNLKPIGLVFAEANISFLVEWWAKMPTDRLTVDQMFHMPTLFAQIDIVLMWFSDAAKDLHTFPLRIPACVGLQSVVTRKILDRMVEKGHPRELVVQSLRDLSLQTLKRMHQLRLPNDFYDAIKMTPFFESVWKVIDDWYRYEKSTKHHEQATIAICGPRGTLNRGIAIHQESVKRVTSWLIVKKRAFLAEPEARKKIEGEGVLVKWEHPSWKSSNWRSDCQS
ncbi:hypothetical protein FGRMN_8421 [Fusarium graminum]|nr:hypothetical protein FGRMN_8421 [Fusarium graminum]